MGPVALRPSDGPRLLLAGVALLVATWVVSPPAVRAAWLGARWRRIPEAARFVGGAWLAYAAGARACAALALLWMPRADGSRASAPQLALEPLCRQWDAAWYQSIAFEGYTFGRDESSAAFFPLYPVLVRLAAFVLRDRCAAALAVSHVALLGAIAGLYALGRARLPRAADARVAIGLALSYPFAFFFVAAYPESLFLCAAVWAFVLAERGRLVAAGVVGAAAAATRLVGLLLLPALWLAARPRSTGRERLALLLVPTGTLAFFAYLHVRFGDFWANLRAAAWGWGRGPRKAGHELFAAASAPFALDEAPERLLYTIYLVMALALVPLVTRLLRARATGDALFVAGLALAGLSSGLEAFGRYIAPAFPIALALAPGLAERPARLALATLVMALLQALFLILHGQGHWVT